ncbi:MAG: DUF6152 family protein [Rhodospirillaceae bacterium]
MITTVLRRVSVTMVVASTVLVSAALAHHGWSWTVEEQSTLEGTILDIYLGQPHAAMQVETADGVTWSIDLAPPSATSRSGFVEGVAAAGDRVVILGNRAKDASVMRMKAVRITVDGKNYDVYPDRVTEH